jgi:hypothetical protein
MGGQHLLVGLNSDTSNSHTITCATGFGANVDLHDFTGHQPDVWTDGSGNATITMPVNNGGTGYACYAPAGNYGAITPAAYATTQEYAGAQDLDIKPADNTQQVTVSRVYAAAGQSISGSLYYDTSSWTSSTSIGLEIDRPDGSVLSTGTYTNATAQGTSVTATTPMPGFYTWKIQSFNTPADNPKPSYWLKVSYTAPQAFPSAPSVSSINPTVIAADARNTTVTVNGANFDPTSSAQWNGNTLATTYVSAGTLTAVIPAADLTTTGTDSITVATPAPGGGTSNSASVHVDAFANVTSQTSVLRGSVLPNFAGGGYYQMDSIKNVSASSIAGPIEIVITGLPSGVKVTNAAGMFNGNPYLTATTSAVAAGSSVSVRINYSNPTNMRFSYGVTVLSGPIN